MEIEVFETEAILYAGTENCFQSVLRQNAIS